MTCSQKSLTTLTILTILVLHSTSGHAQEESEKPTCKSGSRVEIACDTARACWDARDAHDELATLKPICRELRQDAADAQCEASEERGRADSEAKRADRAEARARRVEIEIHDERQRISRGDVVGWTSLVLCTAAAAYGASKKDAPLIITGTSCAALGSLLIWRQ